MLDRANCDIFGLEDTNASCKTSLLGKLFTVKLFDRTFFKKSLLIIFFSYKIIYIFYNIFFYNFFFFKNSLNKIIIIL